ncbi:hypothetical protein JTB14_015611 [Gonioctena quinquepunctata]|nr:hypothetical protein JTB14_015611 [Gonioctena quinquepunctata]
MPKKDKIIWTEKKLKEYDADKFSFLGGTGLPACFDTLESPVDFFSLLFPDDLLDLIVVESNLKSVQDNVNKPANITKNELEQFIVLSGSSGFSYDFDIFAGEQSNTLPDGAPDLGVSGNVVTRLTSTVPRNKNHQIFFDNWFNSPLLQVYLTKIDLLPLGTARRNRVTGCEMPSEKDLKRQGRGSMMEKTTVIDGAEVSCFTWFDNKVVTLLSTYVGSSPETTRERYSRKNEEYVNIRCPKVVDVYNKNMGGVDLLDSMLGLYRIKLRSKKWNVRIF